jgi:hypothetical protein
MLAIDFLDALYEGCPAGSVELRKLANDGGTCLKRHFCTDPIIGDRIIKQYARDAATAGVFFGVALRKPEADHGRKEDILAIPALWADIDTEKEGWDTDRTLAGLKAAPIRPSAIVRSGHGLHAYWKLSDPVVLEDDPDLRARQIETVEQTMKRLADLVGGDRTHDITRVLRVPGTLNTKGGKSKPVAVAYADWTGYSLYELMDRTANQQTAMLDGQWLDAELVKARTRAKKEGGKVSALAARYMRSSDVPDRAFTWESLWAHTRYGGGNVRGTAFVGLDEAILRGTAMLYAQYGGIWSDDQIITDVLNEAQKIKRRDAPREPWNDEWERKEARLKLDRWKPRWELIAEERSGKNGSKKEQRRATRGTDAGGTDATGASQNKRRRKAKTD